MAAIPPWAPKGSEGEAYSLEEIQAMLRVLSEPAATVVETAAWTGLRAGELRKLRWNCYKPADDEHSVGLLEVKRSVWRNHVGEPKTERSKAPVLVIPQLALHLAVHRRACGNPISGPIFVNGRGNPRSMDGLYWREMRDVLKKAGIKWKGGHGFRRGLASNLNRLGIDDSVIQAILRIPTLQ
jgi:integrase